MIFRSAKSEKMPGAIFDCVRINGTTVYRDLPAVSVAVEFNRCWRGHQCHFKVHGVRSSWSAAGLLCFHREGSTFAAMERRFSEIANIATSGCDGGRFSASGFLGARCFFAGEKLIEPCGMNFATKKIGFGEDAAERGRRWS